VLAILTRLMRWRAVFRKTIYVTPSRLTGTRQLEIEKLRCAAVRALGYRMGRCTRSFGLMKKAFGRWKWRRGRLGIVRKGVAVCEYGERRGDWIGGIIVRQAMEMPVGNWKREVAASGVI